MRQYSSFLSSPTAKQWKRISTKRRSGVATPLFSIYSAESAGVGEIPDLVQLFDWCVQNGLSIVQLLPLNDSGFRFTPYDSLSSFALDPMRLSLGRLEGVDPARYKKEVQSLRNRFPLKRMRFDPAIKAAKLELLGRIFDAQKPADTKEFLKYAKKNASWLEPYALFCVIKELHNSAGWQDWPEPLREREPSALNTVRCERAERILFYQWIQWQLFVQMTRVKKEAKIRKILLLGDLPFLVSRDSADVWARPDCFRLDFSAGAPPDLYYSEGQEWGMPPYDWGRIAATGYNYPIEKLHYAENFYDLFRIDHFVGLFRLWTIPLSEPPEVRKQKGFFDPADEAGWEEHGRAIINVLVQNTKMLPCAEDLGTIPACSWRVLEEYAIPGMEIQRWAKDWGRTYDFRLPEDYRKNSVAMVSTHDMSAFSGWWNYDAGTVDEAMFRKKCADKNIDFNAVRGALFDGARSGHGRLYWKKEVSSPAVLCEILSRDAGSLPDIIDLYLGSYAEKEKFWRFVGLSGAYEETATPELAARALKAASRAGSIFSIQMLQDWFSLGDLPGCDRWDFRINVPGTVNPQNWTLLMPFSLEEMKNLRINRDIREVQKR